MKSYKVVVQDSLTKKESHFFLFNYPEGISWTVKSLIRTTDKGSAAENSSMITGRRD